MRTEDVDRGPADCRQESGDLCFKGDRGGAVAGSWRGRGGAGGRALAWYLQGPRFHPSMPPKEKDIQVSKETNLGSDKAIRLLSLVLTSSYISFPN